MTILIAIIESWSPKNAVLLRNGLIKDNIDEEANGLFKYTSRILEPQASIKN